jgi:hypothetical protein
MNQITGTKEVHPDRKKMPNIHDDCAKPPLNVSNLFMFK